MRLIFGDIGWEKKVGVFLAALALFVLIGPFATYEDLDLYQRLIFWVMILTGVGFFMHVAIVLALASPYLGPLNKVLRVGVGAIAAGLPGAAVVVFVNLVFRPGEIQASTLPVIWVQVSAIGVIIGLVEYIDWRSTEPTATTEAAAAEPTPTPAPDVPPPKEAAAPTATEFHKRLPERIGKDIISLSMQDHYVEVTTTQGKHLVLMRMGDAIAELKGLTGQRIHRSHWVALSHARDLERDGARHRLFLSDGRNLPVSASYHAELAAALNGAS